MIKIMEMICMLFAEKSTYFTRKEMTTSKEGEGAKDVCRAPLCNGGSTHLLPNSLPWPNK